MDKAPNGLVVQEHSSGEDDVTPPMGGAGKDTRKHGDENPVGSAGAHPHREHTPHSSVSPTPVDQILSALRGAGLTPGRHRHHGLDPFPHEDRNKPKVKIPPPVFKGLPGERPDMHLLATLDWMKAM